MAPPSTETTGHPARQRQQQQPLLPYHHHHHHHHHYHHHHSHDPSPNTRLANNANYAGANSSSRTAAFQPHPNAPMYTNGGTSSTSFGERNGSNNNNNPHNGGLNLRLPSRMLEGRFFIFFNIHFFGTFLDDARFIQPFDVVPTTEFQVGAHETNGRPS